jgi:hypothetical protein
MFNRPSLMCCLGEILVVSLYLFYRAVFSLHLALPWLRVVAVMAVITGVVILVHHVFLWPFVSLGGGLLARGWPRVMR